MVDINYSKTSFLKSFLYFYLIIGILVTSTTDLLDGLIHIGSFYLSADRLYIMGLFLIIVNISLIDVNYFKQNEVQRKFSILISVYLIFIFLSVFQSNDFVYSFKKLLFTTSIFLFPILIFMLLNYTKIKKSSEINFLFKVFIYTGLLLAFFGILQQFTGYMILWHEERIFLGLNIERVNSLFYDPNFFGYYLIIPFFLIDRDVINNLFIRVLIRAIILIAVFMTGSHGSVLAFLMGYFYITFNKFKIFRKLKYMFMMILPFIFIVFIYLKQDLMLEYISNQLIESDLGTGNSRFLSWYAGLMLLKNNFLFGIGPGNFVTSDKGFFLESFLGSSKIDVFDTLAAHSNYIEIAVESGLFALFFYLVIFISLLKYIDKYEEKIPMLNKIGAIIFATMVANITLSYFSFSLFLIIGIAIYVMDKSIYFIKEKKYAN
jgi:O-antigen ligase